MEAAPPLVQEAVMSQATQQVIEQLGKQYTLHIDVIGLLMKLSSYMLLGYSGPKEALEELRAASVPEQQARQIIDDINKKIFVPLREKMRGGIDAASQSTKPAEAIKPVMPMAQPETHFHLQNRIEHPPLPKPQPEGSQTSLSSNSTLGDVVRSALATPPPSPKLLPPKPVENEKLLEDHEEPHIEIDKKTVPSNLPGVVVPAGIIPPGVRFSPVIPEVRPSPIIPKIEPQIPPIPKVAAPSTPVAPAPSKPSVLPPAPPIKSYSVDPYREPIDEEGV